MKMSISNRVLLIVLAVIVLVAGSLVLDNITAPSVPEVESVDLQMESANQLQYFGDIGTIRTGTKDAIPFAVTVTVEIGYDPGDIAALSELTARVYELRDFTRNYFRSKYAADLSPENENLLKQEMLEQLNTYILNVARAREINFASLELVEIR